jgi:hypothetical protein
MKGPKINVGRRGPHSRLSIPGTDVSWQFGGRRHMHKAVQVQADVKAVHAQGTVKAVQAQAEIIAIAKRMETVAKRLMNNVVGGTYWKKAAIEQAKLLDKMLEVATASENDQLIGAVRRCHNAWADGNPHYRAALDTGMTVSECLARVFAEKQPDQSGSVDSSNPPAAISKPATTAPSVRQPTSDERPPDSEQTVLENRSPGPTFRDTALQPSFWKTIGLNSVFSVIGSGVTALIFMIAARQTELRPPVIGSATPILEQVVAAPATRAVVVTPAAENQSATPLPQPQPSLPTPQLSTPTPWPAEATPRPLKHDQMMRGKSFSKPPTHGANRRSDG